MTSEEPHVGDGWTFATLYKLCMQMFASVEIKSKEIELRQQQRYDAQESIRLADRLYFDTKVRDLHELKSHDFAGVEKTFANVRADLETAVITIVGRIDNDKLYMETKIANLREVSVHDLSAIEQRFQLSKEAVADALSAAKEAVTKAEAATERRFASVNEFRSTLSDQASQLMPRAEAQTRFETLQSNLARIELDLRGSVSSGHGKSAISSQYITTGVAIIAVIVSLVVGVLMLPHSASNQAVISPLGIDSKRVDDLVARIDSMSRHLDTPPQK